jgi:hypothetical protein
VKEPETVFRFLGNFSHMTTQMFRDINIKVFKKRLDKSKSTSITIDIDSTVVNLKGHQEGTAKDTWLTSFLESTVGKWLQFPVHPFLLDDVCCRKEYSVLPNGYTIFQ